jgi:hypothetical protein
MWRGRQKEIWKDRESEELESNQEQLVVWRILQGGIFKYNFFSINIPFVKDE